MSEPEAIADLLAAQRAAHLADGPPSAEVRVERLDRLIRAITANADALVQALDKDYGCRSATASVITDVSGVIGAIKHSRKHVRRWMKPTRRSPGQLRAVGARARVEWQPLGVVGIISPWNFPVALAFHPAAQAIAAGNRVMIKVSEHVPATSAVMQDAIAREFDPTEVTVVTGEADVGAAFSALPFDHLLYTGSGAVGRHVMRAAAENLVPVTLELGGKSPVVIAPGADLEQTADRVVAAKTLNAGQICLTADYVLAPEGNEERLVAAMRDAVARRYPRMVDNDDYTSVLGSRNLDRLTGMVEDARDRGARIVELNPAGEDFSRQPAHKLPLTLVVGADDSMAVMQEEIFGPVLPIVSYSGIDQAIDYVNGRDRPLAAYYFGPDDDARRAFAARTSSGGLTINDLMLHFMAEDLPFGGVGPSGMGSYHGREGFQTFSHARAVVATPGRRSPLGLMAPPYGRVQRKLTQLSLRGEAASVRRRLSGAARTRARPGR